MEVEIDIEAFKSLEKKQLRVLDAIKNVNDVSLNLRKMSSVTGLPPSSVWDSWQRLRGKCRLTLKIEALSAEERLKEVKKDGKV